MESLALKGANGELTSLDQVIRETITTLESGKNQFFAAAEQARNEYSRLNVHLLEIDRQLADLNREPDFYQNDEKQARKTYLENKKHELENSLANLRETAEKAENMVSQVGVVMDFIRGNLKDINLCLETLQQKQQLGLQIIKAQEEERKRVAREIHDGPAQSMANVVLRMEFCEKLLDVDPDKVRGELRELKDIVRSNLQDMRKIIFDLRPMALDDLGVVPALKRYVNEFKDKNNLDIEMDFRGQEARLEPVLEIALFRVVQEALNNVVKHSRATRVKISLEMLPEMVKVVVEDNGVGFLLERVLTSPMTGKFGLISMKERADLLGGEIDITTGPGQGTRISLSVPITGY